MTRKAAAIGVLLLWLTSAAQAQKEATVLTRHAVQDGNSTLVQYGSGTVISKDDTGFLVLSCAHVLESGGEHGQGTLKVTTAKGRTHLAQMLECDAVRDLSLIRVKSRQADVGVAVLADDETYRPGMKVYKCGHPGGNDFIKEEGKIRDYSSRSSGFENLIASARSSSGDSGGGVYRVRDDRLIGVVWGGGDDGLRAVRLPQIRHFLDAAKVRITKATKR